MHTLYIKTHDKTGLKYFGYTSMEGREFEKYKGSGTHWKRHLKKHGNGITTEIVYESKAITKEMIDFAVEFSETHSIVENTEWANLMNETCEIGLAKGFRHSGATKARMSESAKGKKRPKSQKEIEYMKLHRKGSGNPMYGKHHTEDTRKQISESNLGKEISIEQRKLISKKHLEMEKVVCPHCGEIGKESIMKRWHFDNCKEVKVRKMRKCPHCEKEGSNNMDRYHFDNCKFK